jgi:hypothetical protein
VTTLLLTGFVEVLSQEVQVTTVGPKLISATLVNHFLVRGERTTRSLQVVANAAPSPKTFIEVSCTVFNAEGIEFPSPSTVVLDESSWSNPQSLFLQPLLSGNYSLQVTLRGVDASLFTVTFPADNSFEIAGAASSIQMPQLQHVMFRSDGLSVVVQFDSNTDCAGGDVDLLVFPVVFDCSTIFVFPEASHSGCIWENAATAVIQMTKNSHWGVGGNLTILGNRLRAACSFGDAECVSVPAMPEIDTRLQKPLQPVVPNVVISAPSFVGNCGTINISLELSTGSAGRNWKSVSFSIINSTGTHMPSATEHLVNLTHDWLYPLQVPSGFLHPGSWYVLHAELCNVFDSCAHAHHPLHVSELWIPSVEIVGNKVISMPSSRPLSLRASASIRSCDGTITIPASDLEYSWCINKDFLLDQELSSSALTPTEFKLPPFSLNAYSVYEIMVTVRHGNSSSYAAVTVKVNSASIVAAISGPSQRTVRLGEAIVLDASGSCYDDVDVSNVEVVKNVTESLTFGWNCYVVEPLYNSTCEWLFPGVFPVDGSAGGQFNMLDLFFNNTIAADEEFQVMVSVSVSDVSHFDQASILLRLVSDTTPSLTVTAVAVTNPADSLVVYGQVDLDGRLSENILGRDNVSFGIDGILSNTLSMYSTTPITRTLTVGTSHVMNLVLRPNVLEGRAEPYRVTLSTTSGAFASISVRVNQPPVAGELLITPHSGFAFLTPFFLAALRWEDLSNDLPLSYEFGFESLSEIPVVLRRKMETSVAHTDLPSGQEGVDGNTLICFARVFDIFDAMSAVASSVTVLESSLSLSNSSVLLPIGNAEMSSVLLASVMINTVDCSQALDCASLQRRKCSSVNQTCGQCLEGTIGDEGSQNTPCISAVELTEFPDNKGRTCLFNADCLKWEVCPNYVDGQRAVCESVSKACPNMCSGQGTCSFVNVNTGVRIESCFLGNPMCSAECHCHEGYTGRNCKDLETESARKQNITLALLNAFDYNLKNSERDMRSFSYWIVVLETMIQDEYLISRNSFSRALDILSTCFGLVEEFSLHVSKDDMQRVGRILNVLLKSLLRHMTTSEQSTVCPDPLMEEFSDIFNLFELLVLDNLVEGEEVLYLWADLFRSSSQHTSPNNAVSLQVPSSSLEQSLKSDVSSTLSANHSNALSIFSFKARAYGRCADRFISNPIHIVLDHRVGTEDRPRTTTSIVRIPNLAPQEYPLPEKQLGLRTDCATGDFSTHNYSCVVSPSENFIIVHQCKGVAERFSTDCPSVSVRPSCDIIDGSDELFDCNVKYYTVLETVCVCTLNLDVSEAAVRRQMTTASKTYNLRLVTTTGSTAEESAVETAVIKYGVVVEGSVISLSLLVIFTFTIGIALKSVREDIFTNRGKKNNLKDLDDDDDLSSGADTVTSADHAVKTDDSAREQAAIDITAYLAAVLPVIFRPTTSLLKGCFHELRNHHSYFGVDRVKIPGESAPSSNTLRMCKQLFVQVSVLLMLTILYEYQVCF